MRCLHDIGERLYDCAQRKDGVRVCQTFVCFISSTCEMSHENGNRQEALLPDQNLNGKGKNMSLLHYLRSINIIEPVYNTNDTMTRG